MISRDLFSALNEKYDNGRDEERSILENLQRIFNTRQGMVDHMPDYGLPDIHGIYMTLPESYKVLEGKIADVVEKYEKRLKVREVRLQGTSDDMLVAGFRITAEFSDQRGSRILFLTELRRDGATAVRKERS